jgi:hypothetical protein
MKNATVSMTIKSLVFVRIVVILDIVIVIVIYFIFEQIPSQQVITTIGYRMCHKFKSVPIFFGNKSINIIKSTQ